jgi:hypothetical protein
VKLLVTAAAVALDREQLRPVATTAKTLVQADLEPEPSGLFWADNAPGAGTKPGRVSFIPASQLHR